MLEDVDERVLEGRVEQHWTDMQEVWREIAGNITTLRKGQERIEGDLRTLRHATVGTLAVIERAQAVLEDRIDRLEAREA